MTGERWRAIERIYNEALDRSPDERGAFVSAACAGDTDLQREIEGLLAAGSKDSLLDRGAVPAAAEVFARIEQQDITGRQLGPFQVMRRLGEGGMGVVYQALDTRLKRFVAIKILRPETLADADRRRRFVQEARAASALNHPNIVTVHDIGTEDGVDYIAMEFVAGKTLDAIIPRKGMRIRDVLRIAIQIAAGLERAHAARIVHRDLKPGNVIVREDGQVKILDFGLAKLAERGANGEGLTETAGSPTVGRHTKEGTVVGTVAYMSPEQAEGRRVDARSDIFSFGSVLYEMVTGQRPFKGDSATRTMAAILNQEPAPVRTLAPQVPRDLEKIVNRCLRKDPDRRSQHIGDVRVALLELKEDLESGRASDAELPERKPFGICRTWVGAVFAAVILTGVAGVWWHQRRPSPEPLHKASLLTAEPGVHTNPSLSPDGKQVAYAWTPEGEVASSIYVKIVGVETPLRLTSNASDTFPAWSPDGRYIAFCRTVANGSEILSVPALGGPARRIAAVGTCFGLTWSPDGHLLAAGAAERPQHFAVVLVSAQSGETRKLTSPPPDYYGDTAPKFSPDGKTLLFVRVRTAYGDLYTISLQPDGTAVGEPRKIDVGGQSADDADWTADGRRVMFSGGVWDWRGPLFSVPASGGSATVWPEAGENVRMLSVARSGGRLVFERVMSDSNIWRLPGLRAASQAGPPTRFVASTESDEEPQYSPDGTRIAFTSERFGGRQVWVSDADGRNALQLTSISGLNPGSPRWSPEGRSLAFDSAEAGNWSIFVISAFGGSPRRITTDSSNNDRPSWSRDGRWIYFGSDRTGTYQIWKVPVAGGRPVQVTRTGGEEAFESVDGRYLYWAKQDVPGIWRTPVAGGEETRIIESSGKSVFTVAPPGVWFFDINATNRSFTLKYLDEATGRVKAFRDLPNGTHIDIVSSTLSVSPDGLWIIYTQIDKLGSNLIMLDGIR